MPLAKSRGILSNPSSVSIMDLPWSAFLKTNQKHLAEVGSLINEIEHIFGYVVDYTDDLLLLHNFSMDTFSLNGYSVIRMNDIEGGRFFNNAEYWQYRAIRRLKLKPVQPVGINLETIPTLLESIDQNYPLMALYRERIDPDVCYIGSLKSMSKNTFIIDDLSSNATWSGPRRLRYDDITRIDFGGGYEAALAMVADK